MPLNLFPYPRTSTIGLGVGLAAAALALMAGRMALGVFLAQLFATMRETLLLELDRDLARLEVDLEQIAQAGYAELAERLATVYQLGLTYMPGSEVSSETLDSLNTDYFDWAYGQAQVLVANGQKFSFGQVTGKGGFARSLHQAYYAAIGTRQVLVRLSVNTRQSRCLDSFGPPLLLLALVALLGFTLPAGVEIVLASQVSATLGLAIVAGEAYLLAVAIVHLLFDAMGAFGIARVLEIGTKIADEQFEALASE
ncbi:MAG: hypothetical protein JW846_08255 [Dehalococcoidia bacterium]|nr:hypothetical protein [Dehalococcoidia bacterium]